MRVNQRVENLLKYMPELRNSDKKLLLAYWQKEGLELTQHQRDIFMGKCTVAESITRQRRKLRRRYPACKAVEEGRAEQSEQFRLNMGEA